jgi:hypothetical protein
MKLKNTFSIRNLTVYLLVLSLGFVCVGCSSKTDKEEAARLRRENDELKKTLAGAIEEKEEIQRRYDGLKKALTEAVGEKVKIQNRYDGLKSTLAGAIKEKEQIQSRYDGLKKNLAGAAKIKEEIQRRNDGLKKGPVGAAKEKEQTQKRNDEQQRAVAESVEDELRAERIYRDKHKVDALIAEFDSAVSSEKRIELIKALKKLSFELDPRMTDLVQKALDNPDPEVGRAAIELLEDYDTPADVLPLIEQALNSADTQTRIEALSSLSSVDDPQAGNLLAQALSDTSIDIRAAALEAVEWHENDSIQLDVMKEGIASEYDDVKYEVASALEDRSDHSAVDILIEALKDNDPDFRQEVNSSLDFMIDRKFETYGEALIWWNDNKDNYDEELFLK